MHDAPVHPAGDAPAPLRLGISPCPNDTFIFGGLLTGQAAVPGLAFDARLEDVETLNALAVDGRLDVAKVSAAAAGRILGDYALLDCGGALGRGCGPLLVARPGATLEGLRHEPVASPGELTTANLLLDRTGLHQGERVFVRYEQVMPLVASGRVAAGVVIHEGRFTYGVQGLALLLDLGQWWERETDLPIPLGVIAVRRALGPEVARSVAQAIRASLGHAQASPKSVWPFVKAHAQEMDDEVIRRHIDTFVTGFSERLGDEGREAVLRLLGLEGRGAEVFAE